jgi:hypothetical protein
MATAFTQETDTSQQRFDVRLIKHDEDVINTFTWASTYADAVTRMAEQTADPVWSGWSVRVVEPVPVGV